MPKLNATFVNNLPIGIKDKTFWDDSLTGFGLRVQGNTSSWVLMYRNAEGRQRKLTITAAAEAGLDLSFNRVLFEGASQDLKEQLDFIEKYDLRLKLYDLLWTPEISDVYDKIYIDWKQVVNSQISHRTKSIDKVSKGIGRERIRFYLEKGGFVEIKRGDIADRSKYPCYSCSYKSKCLEDFGDYLRVDPELNLYSCYMRRDIGFNLQSILNVDNSERLFRGHLKAMIGPNDLDTFLSESSLRYTVVPHCNFNCRVPGTKATWCMEEPGGFKYPKMKESIILLSDIKK